MAHYTVEQVPIEIPNLGNISTRLRHQTKYVLCTEDYEKACTNLYEKYLAQNQMQHGDERFDSAAFERYVSGVTKHVYFNRGNMIRQFYTSLRVATSKAQVEIAQDETTSTEMQAMLKTLSASVLELKKGQKEIMEQICGFREEMMTAIRETRNPVWQEGIHTATSLSEASPGVVGNPTPPPLVKVPNRHRITEDSSSSSDSYDVGEVEGADRTLSFDTQDDGNGTVQELDSSAQDSNVGVGPFDDTGSGAGVEEFKEEMSESADSVPPPLDGTAAAHTESLGWRDSQMHAEAMLSVQELEDPGHDLFPVHTTPPADEFENREALLSEHIKTWVAANPMPYDDEFAPWCVQRQQVIDLWKADHPDPHGPGGEALATAPILTESSPSKAPTMTRPTPQPVPMEQTDSVVPVDYATQMADMFARVRDLERQLLGRSELSGSVQACTEIRENCDSRILSEASPGEILATVTCLSNEVPEEGVANLPGVKVEQVNGLEVNEIQDIIFHPPHHDSHHDCQRCKGAEFCDVTGELPTVTLNWPVPAHYTNKGSSHPDCKRCMNAPGTKIVIEDLSNVEPTTAPDWIPPLGWTTPDWMTAIANMFNEEGNWKNKPGSQHEECQRCLKARGPGKSNQMCGPHSKEICMLIADHARSQNSFCEQYSFCEQCCPLYPCIQHLNETKHFVKELNGMTFLVGKKKGTG
jgi:hypothetical protein